MAAGERESLRGWLDYHRATLAWKCDGLTDEQLRRNGVASSSLTLVGLVRHKAEVDRHWFRRIITGETIRHVWSEEWDFQEAFDVSDADPTQAFAAWGDEVDSARVIEAGVRSLDDTFDVETWDCEANLRTILLHLIHDYARHNGHADLLREGIDGSVGS